MKNRKIAQQVRFFKHKKEQRYLRIEGDKTSQYIFEKRGNTTTQKTIQNANISVLELQTLYREINHTAFNTALYNGHSTLNMFEFGQDVLVFNRSLKTA